LLSQLFAFIAQFWKQLLPWYVLNAEEVGFIRRNGIPKQDARPGLHYKHPLLETLEAESTAEYNAVLDPQSLTTKDGVDVVIRAAATCHVFDARRYFLNVTDGRTNVQDLVGGELAWLVNRRTAKEVLSGRILAELSGRSCKAARHWGIHIETVKFLDSVAAPSHRLWQTQSTSAGQE
jgi:regulator of protease activity HflC (stomatin/prohibitin superfamily)